MKVIWKQEIVDEHEVSVDFHDRGYQFGDGLYEVVRVHNGKFFTLKEHNDRLFNGAQKIEMELPFTKEELSSLLEELVSANELHTGYVYLQVSRGDGIRRNHIFPSVEDSTPVLTGFTVELERQLDKIQNGVDVVVIPDRRWLNCDIKSISLMGNVLAKNEATKVGAHEVIQHRDGIITECGSSNVMVVKDNVVYTHPNDNLVLPGITKYVILNEAKKAGITVFEGDFTIDLLAEADEVFLSSTLSEVMPIVEIDGKAVADGKPGPITQQLAELYVAAIERECGKL